MLYTSGDEVILPVILVKSSPFFESNSTVFPFISKCILYWSDANIKVIFQQAEVKHCAASASSCNIDVYGGSIIWYYSWCFYNDVLSGDVLLNYYWCLVIL